jgi:hypothetical protein
MRVEMSKAAWIGGFFVGGRKRSGLKHNATQAAASFQSLFGKPTLVHFQHKTHRLFRAV